MNLLPTIMNVVSGVLQVYMLLLIIRIVLTWVSMDHGHPLLRLLHQICDPYLNWFRRFRFLVLGSIDFSPLAALLVIDFFANLARYISHEGQLSAGIVLSILVQLLWGAISFFFLLIAILATIRFLAIQFRWGGQTVWAYFDALLQPAAYAVGRWLRPGTFMAYTTSLLILGIGSFVIWFGGGILIRILAFFLHGLPF